MATKLNNVKNSCFYPLRGVVSPENQPHLPQRALSNVRNMRRSLEGQRNKPGPPEHKLSITIPKKGDFTFSLTFVNDSGGSTSSSDGGDDAQDDGSAEEKEEEDAEEEEVKEEEEEEKEEEEAETKADEARPRKKKPRLQTYECMEKGEDLPGSLREVDFVAARFFPEKRRYTKFYMEGCQVENNEGLIKLLNSTMRKKIRSVVRLLSSQRTGQQEMFEYNSYTQRTTVNIPANYMLIIPEDLSYQLGMEGRVYTGPRTKAARTTDVNYRNHTIYIYTNMIQDGVVGDKRAPLLRQMAVHPNSSVNMRIVKHTYFIQVSVYLRDSAAQPIPFEYGEVSVVLSLRPSLAVRGR